MRKLEIEEYKERVFNVLISIDKICRENELKYMLCYRTLLGAVRHKGFIPWDDDIDIVMPREDYYKLGGYLTEHPECELNFIDISNRKDTIYYCAKICDSRTIVKESRYKPVEGYGAFVDVFPLDYLPDDEKEREKLRKKELFWIRMAQHAAELSPGNGKTIKQRVLKNLAFICSRFFVAGNILRRMHVRYMRMDQKPTKYIGVPWSPELFEAAWFDNVVEIEFEGHAFLAPAETDKVLTACYGDYMQLPPEKDRVYKHHLVCYERD
ncbi:MAG: LicD family protein [Oscillospiraceae bacterium]|nr:LicD family protein [Oscillospiraceae bacterium]